MYRQQIAQTKLSRRPIEQSSVRRYQIQNSYASRQKQSQTNFIQRPVEKYKLGKIPKIKNQIQLQLPTQRQQPTIKAYHKEDGLSFLQKIFPCCCKPVVEPDFIDCDYCDRRVNNTKNKDFHEHQDEHDTTPYLSYQRILQRQKQPVNVFYEEITNERIRNNRYNDYDQN